MSGKREEKEEVEIRDRRYTVAMKADVKEQTSLEGMDKALSQSVIERQMEQLQERTEMLIKMFETKEKPLKHGRMYYKFRAVVRLIMLAQSLKNYGTTYFERMQGVARTEVVSTLPAFDVDFYRRKKTSPFPQQVKRMLDKPSWLRTEDELNLIFRTLSQFNFFYKYPQTILRQMCAVIRYNYVPANRIVLRQGHMPSNFYYILSGNLHVFIDKKDATGNVVSIRVAKMVPGGAFGELALIHNTPRTATVTTRNATELLSVERDDFDDLMKSSLKSEWSGRYNIVCQLPEFSTWSPEQVKDLCKNCALVKYKENAIITGNMQTPDMLYFIADGKCRVIEELRVTAASGLKPTAALTLCALPVEADSKEVLARLPPWATVVRRFLHILTINQGQYFGTGEDLQRRYVVAWGRVECLKISHTYLRHHDHEQWVQVLLDRMQTKMPSHNYVFTDFVERSAWRAYKKDVMKEVIQRSRKLKPTKMKDVPISIRNDEDTKNWSTIQMGQRL